MTKQEKLWVSVFLTSCVVVGIGFLWLGRNHSGPPPVPVATPLPPPVATPTPPPAGINEALQVIDSAALMGHVQHLSQDIGPRLAGTAAEKKAADYIVAQLRSYGYNPQLQWFTTKKGEHSCNVVAHRGQDNARQIVVGAHFDSVSQAPGANDNASGVAVLLETARLVALYEPAFNVTFIAFGSEEGARDGSRHYTRTMPRPLPHGMINMDMVGVGETFAIGKWNHPDLWLMNHCGAAAKDLGLNAKVGSRFGGKSDYAAFSDAGIPVAAFAWDDDPNYHTRRDSLNHIDREAFTHRLHTTARVLVAALLTPEGEFVR